MANTPEEAARLEKGECPVCGCPREKFKPRNRTAVCCCPEHSEKYWHEQRPTIAQMREIVYKEQDEKCAHCKQKIEEFNATEGPYGTIHPYVLDHITPIAMGGSQWARKNLQVLCERCNKFKTARGTEIKEDRTQQVPLSGTE